MVLYRPLGLGRSIWPTERTASWWCCVAGWRQAPLGQASPRKVVVRSTVLCYCARAISPATYGDGETVREEGPGVVTPGLLGPRRTPSRSTSLRGHTTGSVPVGHPCGDRAFLGGRPHVNGIQWAYLFDLMCQLVGISWMFFVFFENVWPFSVCVLSSLEYLVLAMF